MPIKPENLARYPANWQEVRARILERAGNRCEWPGCGARNGHAHPVTSSRVVLTIAHLDHTPEHCEDENLMAMCQLHHLRYDQKHHQQNAYQTRRAGKAVEMAFEEPKP